ncbi:MAG TPA: SDR family NAD(P)-dependent oxidoreductase [Bacteroidota bacterium]|nr:SDR family NAD(P)-dependent oxidoreductase [Bacteroidota bacterium]
MRQQGAQYRDLKNKTVLVTGGGSGLGFAITSAFMANKANVVIVGRNAAKLQEARKTLGAKVRCVAFDMNEIDKLPELVHWIESNVGEVDVLVNNAGINMKKDVLHVTNKDFEGIVQTNQTAVFALTREVLRSMVKRHTGSVIMIGSMAARYGIPKVISYTASKSAVEGMTRALAVECAAFGIRVNCVAPGFIKTKMSSDALESDPERKHRVLARTPMGRLGEPIDVANAVLFLASEQSKFVTGVVLPVDGGNSIGF